MLIISVLIISCKNVRESNLSIRSNNVELDFGDKLILPESVPKHKIFRIVNYIDGDCSVCIETFIKWENFIRDNVYYRNLLNKESLIFIVSTSNKPRFEYYYETANLKLEYQYDTDNNYCQTNNIYNPSLHTVLIDSSNIVKLIGSPFDNGLLLKSYLSELSNNL